MNNTNTIDNLKLYESGSFENVPYTIDDYQLVFCTQVKYATIKENVSTKEEVTKEIKLYSKKVINYDTTKTKFKEYTLAGQIEQSKIKRLFDYEGDILKVYPEPRYYIVGEVSIDLLNFDFTAIEDCYGLYDYNKVLEIIK